MVKKDLTGVLILVSILIAVLSSACAPAKLTREEQLHLFEQRKTVAQKTYQGFTKEQIINAAEKTLTVMDPPDVNFVHDKDGFLMNRYYTAFLVFGSVFGFDFWQVRVSEDGVDKTVTVRMTARQNAGFITTIPTDRPTGEISIEESLLTEAEYRIFFKRLDYMLGIDKVWFSCPLARKFIQEKGYKGTLMYTCGDNYFGIEDVHPECLENSNVCDGNNGE